MAETMGKGKERVLIVSLGGTTQPIVESIKRHEPELICWFGSERSVEKLGEIREAIKGFGLSPDTKLFVVENPDNLVECYQTAMKIAEFLKEKDISPQGVVVDYTGGTKNMTAALVLATASQNYLFSYVGGKERTKDGLGIVVSGEEEVKTAQSPWIVWAMEEKKKISMFFNSYQFEAALEIIKQTKRHLPESEKLIWEALERIAEGYWSWDNFNHLSALKQILQGLKDLKTCMILRDEAKLNPFMDDIEKNLSFLKHMAKVTNGFKEVKDELVLDLFSNAYRRYEQGKYDDGVARLYRTLEMLGQIAFKKEAGCSTSDVDAQKLPQNLKKEYLSRYKSPEDGKIRLPLLATYRLLREIGHPYGERFFKYYQKRFRGLLNTRNSSILAHGVNPVQKSQFESFYQAIREAFDLPGPFQFPKFLW